MVVHNADNHIIAATNLGVAAVAATVSWLTLATQWASFLAAVIACLSGIAAIIYYSLGIYEKLSNKYKSNAKS